MRASLHAIADVLPKNGDHAVLRPQWLNPAVEGGGAGIQWQTDLTLRELVHGYHDLLIASAHAAQFMVLYCKPGEDPDVPDDRRHVLDKNRHETDMIWHTDEHHRTRCSANLIIGESGVPTGIASKPLIAALNIARAEAYGILSPKRLFIAGLQREATGTSRLSENCSMDYLRDRNVTEGEWGEEPQLMRELWEDLDAINAHPDILWVGWNPQKFHDKTQVILTSGVHYHCKKHTPHHFLPRDSAKRRIDLFSSDALSTAIGKSLMHLEHGGSDPVSMDWLRDAGKE